MKYVMGGLCFLVLLLLAGCTAVEDQYQFDPQTPSALHQSTPTSSTRPECQPTYLLPTDPNSAPYGCFLNPSTNINPLNANEKQENLVDTFVRLVTPKAD